MRSTKCSHQSQEWTILSHVICFIQGDVIRFQVLLDSLYPRSTRSSWWFVQGGAVKVLLASVSSDIREMWLNCEECCAWAWLLGAWCGAWSLLWCLELGVVLASQSSFCSWWCHLIPNSFCKHCLRASVLYTSLLVTA